MAFLVAPLAPAVPFALLGSIGLGIWGFTFPFTVAAILGYPVAILFGVPLHFLLIRRQSTGVLSYLVGGLLLGVAAYFVLMTPIEVGAYLFDHSKRRNATDLLYQTAVTLQFIPILAFFSSVSAFVFWLIARPDRLSKKAQSS